MIVNNLNKKDRFRIMVALCVLLLAFTNIAFGNVEGWWNRDIGTTGGSATEQEDTIMITADGSNILRYSDQFHYVYKELSGDGNIQVRVGDIPDGSYSWAKAGAMIRQSLDPSSPYAMMDITGGSGGGKAFQARFEQGGISYNWASGSNFLDQSPGWIYLKREGENFWGWYAPDGGQWEYIGGTQIEMTDPVLIGLCVTSHNPDQPITVPFTQISFDGNITNKQPEPKATNLYPPHGSTDIPLNVFLSWLSGDNSILHDVYFGTNSDQVANATKSSFEYKGTLNIGQENYYPGTLALNKEYHWRIDETDNDLNIHKGNVWSFTTTNSSLDSPPLIDDFSVDAGPYNIEGAEDMDYPFRKYYLLKSKGYDSELDVQLRLENGNPGKRISMEMKDSSLHIKVDDGATGLVYLHHDGKDEDPEYGHFGWNNLDMSNWDGIELGVNNNITACHASLYFYTDSDNYSIVTQTIPNSDVPSVIQFPFKNLISNPDGGPADLTNTEIIYFVIGSYGGIVGPADIEIDSLSFFSDTATDSNDEGNIAPIPIISPLGPEIGGFVRLSAIDDNNATDISYCTFSYLDGDNWVDIGTDFGTVVDSDIKLGEWSALLDTHDVSPGDCRIRAYMEDDSGLYGTDEILLTVGLTPIPIVEVLEYDPNLGLTIFSAGDSFDPDGTISDYRWTFWTYPDIQTFTGDTINFYHPVDYENVTFTLTVFDDMNILTSITEWATEWLVEQKFALEVQEIDRKKDMLNSIITKKQDMLSDMSLQDPGYNHLQDAISWMNSAKDWLDLARGRLALARDWQHRDNQTLEMENLNDSREHVDEAINHLRNDAIPEMKSVKDTTTEATLQAELEASIEELELIMIQLHGLSGKLWLLHKIGPLTHGYNISIPSVLRFATYPLAGGGTRDVSGTHYADSDAIGITDSNESLVIQPSDTDDPDVILHELDHHFMHKKDGWSSPGGKHSIHLASSNNLAWSEGWATFSSAAKQNKSSYNDGEPGPNDDIDQNLEDNTIRYGEKNAWRPIPQAANIEGAISGLLWDLFDGINNTFPENDNANIPFKLIWMALNKSSDPTPPPTFARDIHEFYEHLMNLINNDPEFSQYKAQIPSINQVFTNHNVPKP